MLIQWIQSPLLLGSGQTRNMALDRRDINMPVTVLGCFLVRHNGGRYLFKCQDREAAVEARPDAGNLLIEAWSRELMSCVRDSYIEMVLEIQKLRREPSSSTIEPTVGRTINLVLKAYGDRIYSFWTRSTGNSLVNEPSNNALLWKFGQS